MNKLLIEQARSKVERTLFGVATIPGSIQHDQFWSDMKRLADYKDPKYYTGWLTR